VVRERLAHYFRHEEPDEGRYAQYIENIYVCAGAPVTAILDHARKGGYDLIVMGTHGHGFLYSAVIGSNAQKMVHESEIPVLVVRINGKPK
jgi:nucleotide-binding universal stress UspA family protein